MSSKADRKSSPSRSQLIVTDPAAFLQELKQRLALKEGIPETQQRLIFSVPQAFEELQGEATPTQAAEDILGELGSWQAILFQNGRAIGRLLAPQVSSTQTREEGWSWLSKHTEEADNSVVIEVVSVVYKEWQPVWLKDKGISKNLYLPVDSDFTSSQYTLQVIGRSSGRPFVVPFAYQFSGREVAIALGLEAQRADYIQRHQLLRGVRHSASSAQRQNLAVECGRGLKGLTAVFDAEDRPAWLKSVALRFAVVASRSLDDSAPTGGDQTMPADRAKAAPPTDDQPSFSAQKQPITDQAAKDSWLPKMPAPVSSSKKTKPKPKSKGQERSRLQALAALPSQDVSAQPGNQQEAAGLSEVSQTQPDLPKEAPVPAVSAAAEGQQEPPSPGTVGTPSLADNDTAWGASAEQLRLRSSLQASSRTAQGLPSSTRPKAEQQAGEGAASNALPSKGSPTRSGQGLSSHSPPSRPVTGTSDSFLEGRGLKASTPAALQKGLQISEDQPRGLQQTSESHRNLSSLTPPSLPGASAASEAYGPTRQQQAGQKEEVEAGKLERSPSDDSMVTASSGPETPSPAADAQSSGAQRPPCGSSGSAGSSEGSSFPTFGSLGSEAASGEEEHPAASALPGFSLPNGAVAGQLMPHLPGMREGLWGSQAGPAAPAGPLQWQSAQLSPSASASDLLSGGAQFANGSRQDLMSLLSLQGSSNEGVRGQASSSIPQGMERHPGFSRPYDPLTLCSPISHYDGRHACAAADSTGLSQHMQMPIFMGRSRGLSEGSAEVNVPGGSAQLANGPYMILPMDSSQLPVLNEGISSNGAARLRPGSSPEAATAAAEAGLQPGRASGSLGRDLDAWMGTSRNSPSTPTLPAHLFPQPSQTRELQKASDFTSPLQSARPDLSAPHLANGAFFALPPERQAQPRTAPGQSEGFLPSCEDLPFVPPARPMTGHRYGSSSRAWSHDSGAEPGERALIADMRVGRAAAEVGLGRIMTPPPPPPPRTPPPRLDAEEYSHLGIERQSSFQVPRPPNQGVFDRHGLPSSDIERLMSCVTPLLELNGKLANGPEAEAVLRLADVWRFFEEASFYGREVYTRSGQRGSALAYYTPTLSAIRVLLPCDSPQGLDPVSHAQPLLQHFESELPFNREPFTDALARLAAKWQTDAGRWHDLRLSELHPESWFAVAWYPIYRIPDAPLTAKFLTFHSLRPVPACQTFFGAMDPISRPASTAAEAESSPLCTPILGLKCAEQKGEQWFENYHRSAAAKSNWERRYQQLQARANSLSAGKHLRLLGRNGEWEQPQHSHGDLEWFTRHP